MEIRVPVLIISENGLGAINRTLLTVEALKKRNMEILGIIFNNLSPRIDTLIAEDNVRIVEALSGVSILGEMPYCPDYRAAFNKFTQIGERVEKCVI
jgi:dethiobiotin synthetase